MLTTPGVCANAGKCGISGSERRVHIEVGADFICPECGRLLCPPQSRGNANTAGLAPLLVMAIVLLGVGGGVGLGVDMLLTHGAAARTSSSATPHPGSGR